MGMATDNNMETIRWKSQYGKIDMETLIWKNC